MAHLGKIVALVLGLVVFVFLVTWGFVLASPAPLSNRALSGFSWPVVCSTRGCITTRQWERQRTVERAFAAANALPERGINEALTTLVRQHLVRHASLKSTVTSEDVTRYRTTILNVADDAPTLHQTGLNAKDYDKTVVLAFLQQEALRQQHTVESLSELFTLLSKERFIVVLPRGLWWDKNTATIAER